MKVVLVSLFAGIDGFAVGLINAGFNITTHYVSEIDKHCIANLKYNFPDAIHLGSITDVSGYDIAKRHEGETIIVTGGFPCQDISIAGKRKGFATGTRSSLLTEAVRVIAEIKPRNFIIENVKGLSSVDEGTGLFKTIKVLTYLNSDSPQYTVEVQLLNTSWILPQNRERFYFVGHSGKGSGQKVFPITENDIGIVEGASDTRSIRTLTGGGNSGGMHSSMTLLRV